MANLPWSVSCAGHSMPRPSCSVVFGMTWKCTCGTSCGEGQGEGHGRDRARARGEVRGEVRGDVRVRGEVRSGSRQGQGRAVAGPRPDQCPLTRG